MSLLGTILSNILTSTNKCRCTGKLLCRQKAESITHNNSRAVGVFGVCQLAIENCKRSAVTIKKMLHPRLSSVMMYINVEMFTLNISSTESILTIKKIIPAILKIRAVFFFIYQSSISGILRFSSVINCSPEMPCLRHAKRQLSPATVPRISSIFILSSALDTVFA